MVLPQSILDLTEPEFKPIEDIAMAILREALPDIKIVSEIFEEEVEIPMIMVRRDAGVADWGGDPRGIDRARVKVFTFTMDDFENGGLGGDREGALLSEAVRVVFRDAYLNQWSDPELGYVKRIDMTTEPSRVSDWITSSGPVQFADLPTFVWRYETTYYFTIRKPRT